MDLSSSAGCFGWSPVTAASQMKLKTQANILHVTHFVFPHRKQEKDVGKQRSVWLSSPPLFLYTQLPSYTGHSELFAFIVEKSVSWIKLHTWFLTQSKTDVSLNMTNQAKHSSSSSSDAYRTMSALLICHSLTRCLFSLPFCWSQRRSPVSVFLLRPPGVRLFIICHMASCALLFSSCGVGRIRPSVGSAGSLLII